MSTATITGTTPVQINRLRTLLAWCEDNAHTLPDGWDVQVYPDGRARLSWYGKLHGIDADTVAARLVEAHGAPDEVRAYASQTHAQWDATSDRPELTVFDVTATITSLGTAVLDALTNAQVDALRTVGERGDLLEVHPARAQVLHDRGLIDKPAFLSARREAWLTNLGTAVLDLATPKGEDR